MNAVCNPAPGKPDTLAPEESGRVVGFARACRAAARAIALYPPEHPAVVTTLEHVVEAANRAATSGELRLSVLPDGLTVDGKRIARPDPAVAELAALLHGHQIGQLSLLPQSTGDEWRQFLALVALPPEQTRRRGGLGRLWAAEGPSRILTRQIDYSVLLLGRIQGDRATWESIVANCLEGDMQASDDWIIDLVLEILNRPEDAGHLLASLEQRATTAAGRAPIVVMGLFHAVAQFVTRTQPEQLDSLLTAMAEAASRLSTDALVGTATEERPGQRELGTFVASLVQRMSDTAIADRVVQAIRDGQGSSPMLAEFLSGFVPDVDRRSSILALARHALEHADASGDDAANIQDQVERLLTVHNERPFISDAYATELRRAAVRAVDLDRDATDPPSAIAAWVDSVSDDRIRILDAHLLVDLMQLKRDVAEWREMAALAVTRVSVLIVVGDFDAAAFVVEAFRLQQEGHPNGEIREAAGRTLDGILNDDLMRHVASHLDTTDGAVAVGARRFCQAIGPSMVPRLAEVLSREDRTRTRQHLIGILTAFGPAGRQSVERLMRSSNAAVRRTAVLLLREFGGEDALPKLESMLHDEELHVQREATRAVALLAMETAFESLTKALLHSTAAVRAGITSALWTLPAEETAPVLAYIVTRAPLGGPMRNVQERAMQRLGTAGGQVAVTALGDALRRGSLLTPVRSVVLRRHAADALARIGTPEAIEQLSAAAVGGTLGVRAAAKAALASTGRKHGAMGGRR